MHPESGLGLISGITLTNITACPAVAVEDLR